MDVIYALRQRWQALLLLPFAAFLIQPQARAQEYSVAHDWSEVLLEAIRVDLARPTIHARNLHHTSVVMYDAWAVYDSIAQPYFLGNTLGGFEVPFECVPAVEDAQAAQEEAISYAAYRLLTHRFANSPGVGITMFRFNQLMADLGYDTSYLSTDYQNGTPADLGNYIAEQMIAFGLQDGANENDLYTNQYWTSPNPNLDMSESGNPDIIFPNQFQPLTLDECGGQTGTGCVDNFLSPEWGEVVPFSMTAEDMTSYDVGDYVWQVYKDPGQPPLIDPAVQTGLEDPWKWGFALVSVWSSHLDPEDETLWDVSPNSIGNIAFEDLPQSIAEYPDFYDLTDGGDASMGYDVNPVTGEIYPEQWVKRADYGRVLAEFWADGPDSETPPGHWFSIINYVNYHPELEKRWEGEGPVLSDLEWDIKTYFGLGGAMHDAAIAAWSIKGYYNYVRPVSAIRYMGEMGQSSDMMLPNYNPAGFPLLPGYIELVEEGDELAGEFGENVDEIKILAWRGPDYITNPFIDAAGVGWILAKDWWPYQRPSFVTPPFAGYISGHSTYSRAAAEILTKMTGSPYFPGGLGVFDCDQNQFLVFEEGPTTDVQLQWPSYRDASDQCSLSRIWGGIHPPADDIPGRIIGHDIGIEAFEFANSFASGNRPYITEKNTSVATVTDSEAMGTFTMSVTFSELMDTGVAPALSFTNDDPSATLALATEGWDNAFTYSWSFDVTDDDETLSAIHVKVDGAVSWSGVPQKTGLLGNAFDIDTRNPEVTATSMAPAITDAAVATGITWVVTFDEAMDTGAHPTITLVAGAGADNIMHNTEASMWAAEDSYMAAFDITDSNVDLTDITVAVALTRDAAGNPQMMAPEAGTFTLAQRNPQVTGAAANMTVISDASNGMEVTLDITFDEVMDMGMAPAIAFTGADPSASLMWEEAASMWMDDMTYRFSFTAMDANEALSIDAEITGALDLDGNANTVSLNENALVVDTENPSATLGADSDWITDATTTWGITVDFTEAMNTDAAPTFAFPVLDPTGTITWNEGASAWNTDMQYYATFDLTDAGVETGGVTVEASGNTDVAGNAMTTAVAEALFSIDTRNPLVSWNSANTYVVSGYNVGEEGFVILTIFDEAMDMASTPALTFPVEDPTANGLTANAAASGWVSSTTYSHAFDVAGAFDFLYDIDIAIDGALDAQGNPMEAQTVADFFDMTDPSVGVEEVERVAFGNLYPNPATEGQPLQVEVLLGGQVQVDVLDATGRLVTSGQLQAEAGAPFQLATDGWSAGTYLLRLERDGQAQHFIVEVR